MKSIPQLESMIKAHWKAFLPKRVKELKAAGAWELRVRQTAVAAHQQMRDLLQQGFTDLQAEEFVLREHVLLEPEEADEADEDELEAAEMERAYQQDMASFLEPLEMQSGEPMPPRPTSK